MSERTCSITCSLARVECVFSRSSHATYGTIAAVAGLRDLKLVPS
jgi:hypothetical protein